MDRLRHLIDTDPATTSPEMARFNARPGELFAAGSVGERQLVVVPREDPLDRVESDIERPRRPRQATAVRPGTRGQAGQQRAASVAPAQAPNAGRVTRSTIRAALRTPAALRTAIILREVLDPPIALRDERQGR